MSISPACRFCKPMGLGFPIYLVSLIVATPSFAEVTPGTSEELRLLKEETVSIAARHEQPISEAPSNVYVITDEDIRQSGATDLPTVLRRIPGIEVMQVTGADINVAARGDNELQANKMLVMVDGRSIYFDAQGFIFWKAIPVTLPEIKRIEVLKGPASAVYGFNAFDGVINIITKSPEEMKGTTLQFGGGEFGTLTASAIQAGVYDKFGYRLSVGRDQNNQWRDRNALAFRDQKFNLLTEYALSSDSRLSLSGGVVDANKFDGPYVEILANQFPLTQAYANVAYDRKNFFIRAWWTENNFSAPTKINPLLAGFIHTLNSSGIPEPTLKLRANTYNAEVQHALEIGDRNRFTYGINYLHNTLSFNFSDHFGEEDRLGLYFQDEWRATDKVTLIGGLRYDVDTFINPGISPRFALVFTPVPNHTLRAGLSVGYRPPTLGQTHLDTGFAVTLPPPFPSPTPIFVRGSKNLESEQIISYETGYQGWYFRHRLRARADVFFNHLSDIITASPNPLGNTTFINGGTADIYGGEAGLEFLATGWLSGFANYSYEHIGQGFLITDTSRRAGPRFKWNLGLRGEWETGLNGELVLYHVGAATYPISASFFAFAPFGVVAPDTRVGSYNLLNIRAGYRFWHEKAEVAVSAFNALNDHHKEHPLGDTIGSRVMGWLTIRL